MAMFIAGHAGARAALVALLLTGVGAAATAADCGKPAQAEAPQLGEDTYAAVQAATELLSKQKSAEAIEKLAKLADEGSSYEKALVNYNLGIAHSSRNDYPNAVLAFAKALAANGLPQPQREQLMYNLGQLYIVTNQYDEGIKVLTSYVASACAPVAAEAHIFLANALSERKRYSEALPQIDQAISKAKETKEAWLQMKLAISYELKDFKACAEALVLLIAKVPEKPDYWKQLSSVFYEMKDDAESVAVLSLAQKQGFLQKSQDVRNLYSVYMMLEAPLKAGSLLEEAMTAKLLPADETNLGSLADAWINARESEKAEATLKRLAAMSEKGEHYYKLGAMYGDNERWQDSQVMLEKALQKGGLKRPGEAWMRLAVAHYGQNDNPGAISALQKAITFDETRKQAGEWLRVLSAQATL
jgi:tetratricopeptide (TPR) repeat protein